MSKEHKDEFELLTKDIPELIVKGGVSSGKVMYGKLVPPQQQILLMSSSDWEEFTEEWAHYQKSQYRLVTRLSASADMGIDVAAFIDDDGFKGVWDNYQCKHYGAPIGPSTAVPEIGKCIWHAFEGRFSPPRKYFFVAPKDCGMSLKKLLLSAPDLKAKVIEKWDAWCSSSITKTKVISLDGNLKEYVEAFDFSAFTFKSTLDLIDEHRKTPYFAPRFGGGLPDRPLAEVPPAQPKPSESRYLQQLLDAYAENVGQKCTDISALATWPDLDKHLGRQREAFYHAESLRNFARDNVPNGTFEELQEEVFAGVIEVENSNHSDGLLRANAVIQAAAQLSLTANGLISVTKVQDKKGICHQLANEDRLKWVKP